VGEVLRKNLSSLRPAESGYIYAWATDKHPFIMRRKDVIEELCHNIGNAYIMCQDHNSFDHFLLHIIPNDPTIQELYKYAKESPIELIDMLRLAVKRGFQGECPVCKDWG